MKNLDEIALGLEDNEALSEAFSRYEVGETCKLKLTLKDNKTYTFEAQINEIDPGKMVLLSLKTEEKDEKESKKSPPPKYPKEPVDAVMAEA